MMQKITGEQRHDIIVGTLQKLNWWHAIDQMAITAGVHRMAFTDPQQAADALEALGLENVSIKSSDENKNQDPTEAGEPPSEQEQCCIVDAKRGVLSIKGEKNLSVLAGHGVCFPSFLNYHPKGQAAGYQQKPGIHVTEAETYEPSVAGHQETVGFDLSR